MKTQLSKPVSETWSPASCAPDVRHTYDLRAFVPGMAPHTVTYLYDTLGRKAGLVYPDGMKVTYR
jgi:hypothetical protein